VFNAFKKELEVGALDGKPPAAGQAIETQTEVRRPYVQSSK
jgi:hypothetical protein